MPRFKVLVAQFPGGSSTHPDVSDWVTETVCKMREDPTIGHGNVGMWRKSDTPVPMTRNQCLCFAEDEGYDYVLMVDSDMCPDLPYEGSKKFWDSSWQFVRQLERPCVIAAPYCGPPPEEPVYVFQWTDKETRNANPDFQLVMFDRQTASRMTGIQEAAALATGVILIDMRIVRQMKHPRFYYEWKGDGECCQHCGCRPPGAQTFKAATEDVAFTRDVAALGYPLYCNWDSWAGHWKSKRVGKPFELPMNSVPFQLRLRAAELAKDSPMPITPACLGHNAMKRGDSLVSDGGDLYSQDISPWDTSTRYVSEDAVKNAPFENVGGNIDYVVLQPTFDRNDIIEKGAD